MLKTQGRVRFNVDLMGRNPEEWMGSAGSWVQSSAGGDVHGEPSMRCSSALKIN